MLKAWLGAALGLVMAIVGAWVGGRREGRLAARSDALEDYAKTRRRMDEIPVDDDPAVLRDWLLHRGKHKRGM